MLFILLLQVITNSYLGDFLSLELINGQLSLTYETGGGLTPDKTIIIGSNLNDGYPHHINIALTPTNASILIDNGNCSSGDCYGITSSTHMSVPTFVSPLYIGGIKSQTNATQFHLSTTSLVCTITSLYINHQSVNYTTVIDSASIVLGSLRSTPLCSPDTCTSNQQCIDLWTRSVCQCVMGYTGDSCQTLSTVHMEPSSGLRFSGSVFANVQFGLTVQSSSGFIFIINKVSGQKLLIIFDKTINFSKYNNTYM